MPIQLNANLNLLSYTGTIKKFFNNCPKPNGWFGCFFTPDGAPDDIRITGTYPMHQLNELKVGNRFSIIVQPSENIQYGGYDIKSIALMPSAEHIKKILLNMDGIGKSTVDKIMYNFGSEAYNVIKNEPERLADIGISNKRIKLMQAGLNDSNISNKIKILNMTSFLSNDMLNKWSDIIDKLFADNYDGLTKDICDAITNDPYSLYQKYNVDIPFSIIDAIAMGTNYSPFDNNRIATAIKYLMVNDYNGEVFVDINNDIENFINSAMTLLNKEGSTKLTYQFIEQKFDDIYSKNITSGLVMENDAIYDSKKYSIENSAASRVANLIKAKPLKYFAIDEINDRIDKFEQIEGRPLDAYQREAVVMALTNRLSVITGGPGRGKSSVAKCIIYCWEHLVKSTNPVQLCAPTGKACNRLSEATGKTNVKTAARFVAQNSWAIKNDDTSTARKLLKEWTRNIVIIDESTMLGLNIALNLLQIFDTCQIVFMGDVDQLPSIEYGQFFRDLYECDAVKSTKLMINHRASGNIISGADSINDGNDIRFAPLTTDDEFTFYDCQFDSTLSANTIIQKYYELAYDCDVNKRWGNMINTCILAPMSKGPDGVTLLNVQIQQLFNPSGLPVESIAYYRKGIQGAITPRIGDRIIFTHNYTDADYTYAFGPNFGESGKGISNGDCGLLTDYQLDYIEDGEEYYCVTIILDDGRKYEFYPHECQGSIELAYAMTIHKSQGSEYQNVILSVQEALNYTRKGFANRNLIYTAVTRAKSKCMMIGNIDAMNLCINTPISARNSRLCQRIEDAL